MELPIHVPPATPRTGFARWIPSVRAVALLTLGVGIGVVAAVPMGGATAMPVIVCVVAASAAAFLAVLFPSSVAAIAAADVLLGVAVMASVFGGLGPLYVPLVLAFFAVTARAEQPARHAAGGGLRWRPAPEFDRMRAPLAAPTVREPEHAWLPPYEPRVVRSARATYEPAAAAWVTADTAERPTWLSGADGFGVGAPDPIAAGGFRLGPAAFSHLVIRAPRRPDLFRIGPGAVARIGEPVAPPARTHRVGPAAIAAMRRQEVAAAAAGVAAAAADGRVRRLRVIAFKQRVVSAAVRARRAVGVHARIGFENLRAALMDEPQIDVVLPPPDTPSTGQSKVPTAAERRLVVLPDSEPVELGLGDGTTDVRGAGRLTLVGADTSPASAPPARSLRTRHVARRGIGA